MTLDSLRPIVAITQARVGSSRLPAKVLREVAGKSLLEWHLLRLRQARHLDAILVATTNEPRAAEIERIASGLGIAVFRGSELNVLKRFDGAARLARARTIVRVTSDCPLIDPALIDALIALYAAHRPATQYAALDVASYPRGLDCEIVSDTALAEAVGRAILPDDREHVTRYVRRRARFAPCYLSLDAPVGAHRWCVDTPEDLALVERVLSNAGDAAVSLGWREIADLIDAHPDWRALNAHVRQKVA